MANLSGSAMLLLVGVMVLGLMESSRAYVFYAGGKDGWVQHPSESYSDWAARNRFQVNDTIVFKYEKKENSVIVVNEYDYDACYMNNPIRKLEGGYSEFKFDRSGPFFFVSGVPGKCLQGQKLVVVVMAVRPWNPISSPPSESPASSPAPAVQPPAPSPWAPIYPPSTAAPTPVYPPSANPPSANPPPAIVPSAASSPTPAYSPTSGGVIPPAAAPSGPGEVGAGALSASKPSSAFLVMLLLILGTVLLS